MMIANKEIARRVNFSQSEKLLLLALVHKNKAWIIGNNNTEGAFWRKKSDVWDEIAGDFNLHSEDFYKRDARQLRKCWENLKTRCKKGNSSSSNTLESQFNESNFQPNASTNRLSTDDTVLRERVATIVATSESPLENVFLLDGTPYSEPFASAGYSDATGEIPSLSDITLGDQTLSSIHQANVARRNSLKIDAINKPKSRTPSIEIVENEMPQPSPVAFSPLRASAVKDGITIVSVTSALREKIAKLPCSAGSSMPPRSGSIAATTSRNDNLFNGNNGATQANKTITSQIKQTGRSVHQAIPSQTNNIRTMNTTSLNKTNVLTQRKRKLRGGFQPRMGKKIQFTQNNSANVNNSFVHQRQRVVRGQERHDTTTQPIPNTADAEKVLRIRLLRTQIREQESRLRMTQQRMRHERERHESVMSLLRKRAACYEAQADKLRLVNEQFDDDDICDDELTWDGM